MLEREERTLAGLKRRLFNWPRKNAPKSCGGKMVMHAAAVIINGCKKCNVNYNNEAGAAIMSGCRFAWCADIHFRGGSITYVFLLIIPTRLPIPAVFPAWPGLPGGERRPRGRLRGPVQAPCHCCGAMRETCAGCCCIAQAACTSL